MPPRGHVIDEWISENSICVCQKFSAGNFERGGHTHNGIEILYVRRGALEFTGEGRRYVVPSGCLIVWPGELPHMSRAILGEYERVAVHFRPEIAPGEFLRRVERWFRRGRALVYKLDPATNVQFMSLLKAFTTLSRSQSTEHFNWLLRHLDRTSSLLPTPPSVLWDAIQLLNERATSDVAIERIAAEIYCSESHLYKTFKSFLNCSPRNYLAELKIQRACELLRSSLSVTEVAKAAGYSSVRGLQTAFRRTRGITPTDYRKTPRLWEPSPNL